MLKNESHFAGYLIVRKLSARHEGEREVYLAKCPSFIEGIEDTESENYVVLTVFNLSSKRYKGKGRKTNTDAVHSIDEIRFLSQVKVDDGFLPVWSHGIDRAGRRRLAWMTQQYLDANVLAEEIHLQRGLCMEDVGKVMECLFTVFEKIASFTNGGGHYNINTNNILLDYDGNNLRRVYLIGLANMGKPCNGETPFSMEEVDYRFRAPETTNGIYNYLADTYSAGIVMAMMMAGKTFVDSNPTEFRENFMKSVQGDLTSSQWLILNKATNSDPKSRFQTLKSFSAFVKRALVKKPGSYAHIERTSALKGCGNSNVPDDDFINRFEGLARETLTQSGMSVLTKTDVEPCGLDEVAGMDEMKEVFRRNFVRIVRNPEVAKTYGIKPCNCTLLFGAPGCGKTFIAEKAAQESGLKYKVISPSDLGSIYIHGGQEKIAETFKEAERNAPMILIFDEFDAIAPKRDGDINVHQANEVNELLAQLNNCADKGVYVLATTNRPQNIDSAVLRSGRTDIMYYVPLPDYKARYEIFKLELKKRPCEEDIDIDTLAKATENYTCSDLAFIVKECARQCFDETILTGANKPLPLNQSRILDVIKTTHSSVSEEEIKEYNEMRDKMACRNEKINRKHIGFL